MSVKIAIIDFQLGNMFSVKNALHSIGFSPEITTDKAYIMDADAAILPGVGAFPKAMDNLSKLGLVDTIHEFIDSGKPFLGICLGLQLLFERSEEFIDAKGLSVFKGMVRKFPAEFNSKTLKVPQIAWNRVYKGNIDWDGTWFKNIMDGEFMYFVHSYYVEPEDKSVILSKTLYEGMEYVSSVKKGNVTAFQFHPEKSGIKGIEIYKNFKQEILK